MSAVITPITAHATGFRWLRFAVVPAGVLLAGVAVSLGHAQQRGALPLAQLYEKAEYRVPMRDGITLHTTVFTPRDRSGPYPILMTRTPYSCQPYGPGQFPARIGPSRALEREGYIFVRQDVRGRWNSEGEYDNMRPHVPHGQGISESSDTYDTIEWLLENIPGHNERVGIWGISYPGFYAAAALPEAHPALVAASPQAPIGDFYFDDFHHHGAFSLVYWRATAVFGHQHRGPTTRPWYQMYTPDSPDGYEFYMQLGALSNSDQYLDENNFFWQQLVEHPNYDQFWQARALPPHLENLHTAVMTVGGWFDAEDLYGPLTIYKTIQQNHEDDFYNVLVMGPWSHGDWSRVTDQQVVGNIWFGEGLSQQYQQQVEAPFFRHFLKQQDVPPAFEAQVFDTGHRRWHQFDHWPPQGARQVKLYLRGDGSLDDRAPGDEDREFTEFISDPDNPVPYSHDIKLVFTPRRYMTEDQRWFGRRPDVLVFQSDVLEQDVTLAGEMLARLFVSTSETDADWVVKLIDVYPDDYPNHATTPEHVRLAGYQQMVRSEIIRGRFRNSYEHPEPFEPGEVTEVRLPLQDVFHTFRPGHRIMVQVQSTWFPLFDRNPQKYVENIFKASDDDFTAATHRVYHTADHPSALEVWLWEP